MAQMRFKDANGNWRPLSEMYGTTGGTGVIYSNEEANQLAGTGVLAAVSTSGSYNDLVDSLTAGNDISISDSNVISVTRAVPGFPSFDASKQYTLRLLPINGQWVMVWEVGDTPQPTERTSNIVGIGEVDYMILRANTSNIVGSGLVGYMII